MAKILKSKSIYYNDVNLIAQPCKVKSRKDIPVELNRIIVSPMESIVGETFALEANKLGLTLALHRFCTPEAEAELFSKLENKDNVFVSIGLDDWKRVEVLSKAGAKNWLIDMANGYMDKFIYATVERLMWHTDVQKLILGNVHSYDGFQNLADIKKDAKFQRFVRVGIGGGSPCATNDSTGYNRGAITELMEVESNHIWDTPESKTQIIADGGIKNAGYAAKAFGAGADYVMMGGYFVKAFEAETHIIGDGYYWGGASHKQQRNLTGSAYRHSEGKEIPVLDILMSLKDLVNELWGGISSAVSYSGYETLTDFIGNGIFEVKENSLPPKRN